MRRDGIRGSIARAEHRRAGGGICILKVKIGYHLGIYITISRRAPPDIHSRIPNKPISHTISAGGEGNRRGREKRGEEGRGREGLGKSRGSPGTASRFPDSPIRRFPQTPVGKISKTAQCRPEKSRLDGGRGYLPPQICRGCPSDVPPRSWRGLSDIFKVVRSISGIVSYHKRKHIGNGEDTRTRNRRAVQIPSCARVRSAGIDRHEGTQRCQVPGARCQVPGARCEVPGYKLASQPGRNPTPPFPHLNSTPSSLKHSPRFPRTQQTGQEQITEALF
jgi:hypothetical protein